MAALNAACLDMATLKSILESILYSEINANNLQVGLLDCSGNTLGKARVPTCDQMDSAISAAAATLADSGVRVSTDDSLQGDGTTANPLKVNVCGILTSVVHDTTLSGYGTCQSPLTVNTSWLSAFILNLADTTPLVHTGAGGGIAGSGTTADPFVLDIQNDGSLSGAGTSASPLALAVQHDDSLDGLGSKASPLTVDTKWLDTQIGDYLADNGIDVATGSGLSGNGSSSSPLALDINHDDSLDGDGTAANPLKVDPSWLASEIEGTILKASTTVSPSDVTETDSVATTIVGGTSQTLGKPDAYVQIGAYLLPAYNAPAASTGG